MEWRDNEGVPQLVFGEELSIGEGLEKARVVRAIIFLWSQGVELIFARTDTFDIKIVESNELFYSFRIFCKFFFVNY